ncbi:hypothetical protein KC19_7G159000 [Ceratodon purpureus]|uniref:Uncharacterized protein n=1 Tax=Ceratodon purpureus TaxID=3225 RepID=A0A8T0HBK1_CERPU|nr:hypothetical protein KC19_7G159000 [Ceratodon purpureus]
MREMRERSAELEATAREERHRHKRQRIFDERVGIPRNFRIVCPCTRCARDDKSHVRLYSTVLVHIRRYLMADRFQIEYREGLRNHGLEHVELGSTSRDPELQTDAEVQDFQEDALPQEPPAQADHERGSNPNSTYMEQQASIPIYPGSDCSRLDFSKIMLSMQARHKVPDRAVDALFKCIRDILPPGRDANGNLIENNVPINRVEAQKVIRDVGFD